MKQEKQQEKYQDLLTQLDPEHLPRHIAIIMDGNGRWAGARHAPRALGHRAGAEALRAVTELCREIKIQVLTVYAFSTENWQRPDAEVEFLMGLLVEYLKNEVALMNREDIRLGFLGDLAGLPPAVRRAFTQALDATAGNQSMLLNLAVNYGGRDELRRAFGRLQARIAAGEISAERLSEEDIAAVLDTAGQPDPDLLIRPSGELRLSNFLPWQSAYSELWFSDKLWPDFGKRDLLLAILDFQQRDRRFGGPGRP